MIDVLKELKSYKLESIGSHDELSEVLYSFTKAFDRLSKEQYKSSNYLEDILDMLEDNSKEKEVFKELKDKITSKNEETHKLLGCVISIADLLEEVYNFSISSSEDLWVNQMRLQMEQMAERLQQYGIARIGNNNDRFDFSLHHAVAVDYVEKIPEGHIIEVLKSGYLFNGNLIRKAEVKVNKKL